MMTDQPTIIVVAGPNGSGKTTLTLQLFPEVTRINPDEIALELKASGVVGNHDLMAMDEADRRRETALSLRQSFLTETVFSHPSKLRLMKEARGLGYRVWLVFVCLSDVYLNLDRVEQRAATGGHDVPTDKVIARYSRSIANGAAALSLADEVWLYDNSAYRKPHRLVARATAGVVTVTVEPPPNWLTRLLEIHSGLHK